MIQRFTLVVFICFFCLYSLNAQTPALADTVSQDQIQISALDSTAVNAKDSATAKTKKGFRWNNLPYFMDDIMVIGGINRSGLYYTVNYLELAHKTGFQIGIENYTPLLEKAFLHYGVLYANRGFEHERHSITFTTHNLDIPLFLAYELPANRRFDWRFYVGTQISTRIGASASANYQSPELGDDYFRYFPDRFQRMDWGFSWGSSMEYGDFYWRFRAFSGVVKLTPEDQGMNSSFSLEFGYFPFRRLRK